MVASKVCGSDLMRMAKLRSWREVFAEAKGEGFDVKVLKEILRLRKQDKDERDEQDSLLDLYLRAMESADSSQAKAA